MTLYWEKRHPRLFYFSVIDSGKGDDGPHDNHRNKMVIVPFEGVSFDRDLQRLVLAEKAGKQPRSRAAQADSR